MEEGPNLGGIGVQARLQKQLMELQDEFITTVGKTIFTPQDVERLTNLLAPILFTMKDSLPDTLVVEKFWEFWKEPALFVKEHPDDIYYIIYYEKGNTIYAQPAKDDKELEEKEREIEYYGGKILQVRVLPAPDFLKELIEVILNTSAKLGLISVKPPVPNRAFLLSDEEVDDAIEEAEGVLL